MVVVIVGADEEVVVAVVVGKMLAPNVVGAAADAGVVVCCNCCRGMEGSCECDAKGLDAVLVAVVEERVVVCTEGEEEEVATGAGAVDGCVGGGRCRCRSRSRKSRAARRKAF